ncbi:MAG: hypothetical protein Q8922_14025 [Bacteroidota bacterium]|nr:hypothetical protein [Bacteroidota bacterium]MDP4233816.1 hypothetical protein [Bacteroidota bacterium]MDP4242485.1 hypothetical protein [Bacteroidota bacterium]MDP4289037.1 hypothetical protein [Bacteroidota bacterium]
MNRLVALIALTVGLAISGCKNLLQNPSSATDPNYSATDPAFAETADNPAASPYYTEPVISYGAPGDGLSDLYDTTSTYLASYTYQPQASVKSDVVSLAVQSATQTLMANAGIVGTGTAIAQDGSRHVMVFAASPSDAAQVPANIGGVATEVRVLGRVHALDVYTGEYRPVVPSGVSVGNSRENSSGTIACVVVKHGIRYILSNNHVLARSNDAVIGEPIVQPGRADNYGMPTGQIGVLSAYKKVSFTQSNVFDAAVARMTTTSAYDEADQFAPSHSWQDAVTGMAVKKVGRTTGITYGTIAATDVTLKVDYDNGMTATSVNQIYIQDPNFLQAGDSGSLLVTQDGNHPVGLCFAGGTDGAFANPIRPILNYFGVEIAGTNN